MSYLLKSAQGSDSGNDLWNKTTMEYFPRSFYIETKKIYCFIVTVGVTVGLKACKLYFMISINL